MSHERTLTTAIHGRYLVHVPSTGQPSLVLIGFHGYAENAEIQLDRLRSIPGAERWVLVSVQGLHQFYRGRTTDVVSSWMTRQDRELMIADNVTYTAAVVDAVREEWGVSGPLVAAGFSQGVAMAFRAACVSSHRMHGVIAVGGDVPPELGVDALRRLPAAWIGRGDSDEWYTSDKMQADRVRLSEAGVAVQVSSLPGGHEWSPGLTAAAGRFLDDLLS